MGEIQLNVANASLKPSALPVSACCVFSCKTLRMLNWSCFLGETFAWRNEGEAEPAVMPALAPARTSGEVVFGGERPGVVFPSARLLTSICRGSIFVERSGFVWIIV